MKKLYQKPDIEYVSLQAEEEIANSTTRQQNGQSIVEGEMDVESSIF